MKVSLRMLLVVLLVAVGVPVERAALAADGLLEVVFLDVGQGDATLLSVDGTHVLIDTGRWQGSEVVDHLTAEGIDQIDLVVVTHPHADHIGEFDRVLAAVEVGAVWWSGATTTSQTFQRALDALDASGADYLEPRVGHTATFGRMHFEVLNPPVGTNLSNVHDSGLATRVTFGDTRWLFTGDIEANVEQGMVDTVGALLDADVYQVGHHGSTTSTTPAFLEAVDPAVAVYSASTGNSYGHPHTEVLDRLSTADVHVYGTDINGTVTATSDGTSIQFVPKTGETYTYNVDGASTDEPSLFSDIAGSTHEQAILAVAAAQIAGGYADGTYRPGEPVSRGQMSTFLTRALDLPPWQPDDTTVDCVDLNTATLDHLQLIVHIGPERAQQIINLRRWASVDDLDVLDGIGPARLADIIDQGLAAVSCPDGRTLPVFDIAGSTHEQAILATIQAGIAGGYADGTYRPGEPVTRGQMATFLTRALELTPTDPPYTDVAGSTHAQAIGAVAAAGIAGGYADGTYRPGEPVTRGQMATFLTRALGLAG